VLRLSSNQQIEGRENEETYHTLQTFHTKQHEDITSTATPDATYATVYNPENQVTGELQ